jgi:hypothetical protein
MQKQLTDDEMEQVSGAKGISTYHYGPVAALLRLGPISVFATTASELIVAISLWFRVSHNSSLATRS